MLFDARAAKLLKAGQHLAIEDCPGLRLEVSATRRSWTYRYKDGAGRMKQVKLGHWPEMPAAGAAAAWLELREVRAAGGDPQAHQRAKVRPVQAPAQGGGAALPYSVADLVADYVAGPLAQGYKPEGRRAAESALDRLLAEHPAWAKMPAEAVTRSVAFDVIESRRSTPTMAQRLRSHLGAAWDHALDAGRLGDGAFNWWRQVQRGKLKSKGKIVGGEHVGRARRTLSDAEVAALVRWLPAMHANGQDMVTMYLWTGTRGGEISSLRPEHVRAEGDVLWWTIPKALTKNARHEFATDQRVPLLGRARELVERRLAAVGEAGWLFADAQGGPYEQKAFGTYVYDLQPYSAKAAARGGARLDMPVTGWSPHDLRRTARSKLSALGCPREVAEAIIGHMPPEIEATYNAYSYDAERVRWLGVLAAEWERLVGLEPV
jgi:integrase